MPDLDALAAELAAEEDELRFGSFGPDTAWELGGALVRAARQRRHPIAIDIRLGERQLFHAALAGSCADNGAWIERKARTVQRFGRSSYRLAVEAERDGYEFEARFRLDPARYAASGGSFPLLLRETGLVGAVTVSGLPGPQDHAFVVATLRDFPRSG